MWWESQKADAIMAMVVALMVVNMSQGLSLASHYRYLATANLDPNLWSICLLLVAAATLRKDQRRACIYRKAIFFPRTLLR
jgi:hypothetical protein